MTTTSPTPQQIAAFNRILDAFFEFFSWSHEILLPPNQRAMLRNVIVARWSDADNAVRELMRYVAALHDTVFQQPLGGRDRLRHQAQQIFQRLFSRLEPNGRGEVLATLHQALEALRPGCTGVPMQTVQPPIPASLVSSSILASALAAAQPVPVNVQGPVPVQQCAATPQQAPMPYGAGTAATVPGAMAASPGAFNPQAAFASVPDIQQQLRQAEMRQHNMMLEQKLWDMQHQMVMRILQ